MSDTRRPGEPEQRPGATGPTRRPAATPQGAPAPASGWNGWGGPGAAAAPDAAQPADPFPAPGGGRGGDGPRDDSGKGRPGWLLPVAIGAGVLVVGGVVAGVLVSRGGEDATPAAAPTVVAPLPTPAVEPAARTATTAFASALPTTVLQYALESSQDDAEWAAAGALEAYSETFTDGAGATVAVRAAQLESPEQAAAFLARVSESLPAAAPEAAPATPAADEAEVALPQSGEVTVGGQAVGTFTVTDSGGGDGTAVWQNGTAVFLLTAPRADVLDLYKAYGL